MPGAVVTEPVRKKLSPEKPYHEHTPPGLQHCNVIVVQQQACGVHDAKRATSSHNAKKQLDLC